jgi:hypothetical protein
MAQIGRPKDVPNAPVVPHRGRPMKLAMSGTMFEGSLRDLLGHFINTVDERWSQFDLRMLKCTLESLMELAKEYKKIVVACGCAVSNKLCKKLNLRIKKYTRKLNAQLSLILIRRTGQDKFFNYTIVPLPLMNVMALVCQTLIQWLESIENYTALTQRELAANYATAMENWRRKGR